MNPIKFGTDGWRAIIAQDYTVANVKRVAKATADWLLRNHSNPSVVIGHDCRFGGEMFARAATQVMAAHGIKSYLAKGFVSTPMVSLGTVAHQAQMGIVITASHNPPSYNGYKLKAHFGGPATPDMISEVEQLIPDNYDQALESIDTIEAKGLIEYTNLEQLYIDRVKASFDLDAIKNAGINVAYDAMYGAGQNVVKQILPDATCLHCDDNPGFKGQAPEPIDKNLQEFASLIKNSGSIDSGLATDGDADRIGLYNSAGKFVDSHHIILLLIHYLHKYKGLNGKVITTFSATSCITKMCEAYDLPIQITKIGFKYICEYMVKEQVLVGGEESGGIAITGHIPERDGIWIGLTIWEFMATTGKSLDELIQEVYDVVGSFAVERNDLHLPEEQKQAIIANCKAGKYQEFGPYKIQRVEDIDGYKFHFDQGGWVMLRPSGTEPVLRVYAEAQNSQEAFSILEATQKAILS